jgi:hypothetical protein
LVGDVSLAAQAPANNNNPLVVHLLSRATVINYADEALAGMEAQLGAVRTRCPLT